jgi:hypothetical protein
VTSIHPYLGEGGDGGLDARHRALDKVVAVPTVRGGLSQSTQRGNPASDIEETRRQLDAGAVVLEQSTNPAGFFNGMKQRYPPRDVLNAAAVRAAALPDGSVNSDLVDATLFGVLAAVLCAGTMQATLPPP